MNLLVVAFILLTAACSSIALSPSGCGALGPAMLDVNAAYDAKRVSQSEYDRIAYLWDDARLICSSPPPVSADPVITFLDAAGRITGKVYQ